MSTVPGDDERAWSADRRDFVADRRDDVADVRDEVARTRDRTVDAREKQLDAREQGLDARSGGSGGSDGDIDRSSRRVEARAARRLARHDQDEAQAERAIAAADRDESTKRREADASPTRLAMAFAEIAGHLYESSNVDEVFLRIAEAAVSTVAGCGMASVTLAEPRGYRTAASTDAAASTVDRAQYETDEGPCLDAVDAPVVYAQSFPDERWPALASRPNEAGVQSSLSLQLAPAGSDPANAAGGSLNSYGVTPHAFSDSAQEIGLILAAHGSVAVQAVNERSHLESLALNLQESLMSRDVIGQAKGVLMERLKVTPEAAFDLLRRASQQLNVKLRDVALSVAETGELVDRNQPSRPSTSAAGRTPSD
jgi:hypothetical protein